MSMGPPTPTEASFTATAAELADLLRRVAARDSAAFAMLYKQSRAKLYGVEVLQEVFVRVWEKAGDYDVDKGFPIAWMATIARNRALDEIRRVRPVSLEDMPEGFEPAAEEVDPLGARDRSERLSVLMSCLETLDEEKRQAVLGTDLFERGIRSQNQRQQRAETDSGSGYRPAIQSPNPAQARSTFASRPQRRQPAVLKSP